MWYIFFLYNPVHTEFPVTINCLTSCSELALTGPKDKWLGMRYNYVLSEEFCINECKFGVELVILRRHTLASH